MSKKWLRPCLVLGLVAALGSLCGCGKIESAPSDAGKITFSKPAEIQAESLKFPYTLPDSTLVAEELVKYRGQYWEDDSGDMVQDVAGLMVYNPTDRMIQFGAIIVEQGTENLYFFVHHLPPQSRCLVLERERKSCQPERVTACRELCIRWDYQELCRDQLDYVGLGPILTIVNRDFRRQDHVILWYKQYVKEGDYYLGGAVRSAHLFFLQPQEQRIITPEYYHAGSARVVAIKLGT